MYKRSLFSRLLFVVLFSLASSWIRSQSCAIQVNNGIICLGDTITLVATGATSYTWMPGNVVNDTLIVSPSSTTNYTITATTGTCTVIDSALVTVVSNPTVTVASATLCQGGSTTLTAYGAVSYTWSPATGLSSTIGHTVTASPVATTTYTVVGAVGTCTSTPATTTVIVNSLPTIAAAGNGPRCVNSNLQLTSNGAVVYQWSGPNSFTSNQQNPSINAVTLAGAGTYTVIGTDANNCSDSTTVNVIVNPLPVVNVSNNSPVCPIQGINLSVNNSGVSYTWSGPSGFNSNQQNPYLPSADSSMSGNYVVTVTDANGCTNTGVTTVTVYATPTLTPVSNYSVCGGSMFPGVTFSGNPSGPTSFVWSSTNSSIGLFSSGSGNIPSFMAIDTSTGSVVDTIFIGIWVNGCPGFPDQFSITVLNCIGVAEVEASILSVFPNPTSGEIHLSCAEKTLIEIFDQLGVKVFSEKIEAGQHTLLIEIPPGVYELRSSGINRKISSAKLIRQ